MATRPGGSGKTRLADQAQVAAVVAAALGIREQPGLPPAEALAQVLARRQLLLVLDNCEHVTGAAAQLCAGLVAACDDVRVLATSREPLRVAGEARYRLAPLTLPAPGGAAGRAAAGDRVGGGAGGGAWRAPGAGPDR